LRSIPSNVHPVTQTDGTTTLEIANLPAFQAEEYMPPEAWVRGRVGFFYLLGPPVSRTFWMDAAKTMAEVLAPFLGDAKKLKPVVAGIISAGDSPDTQLRKLYHRVQQIRYISYEPSKTGQETRRENLKENKNVEDVLKHDYAYSNEINLVLVALARAAGFEAAPLRLKSRDTGFFAGEYPNLSQLDAMVVWARAGEKDYLLDPATQYCPFDLLPWPETAATGIAITAGLTSLKSNESIANFDSLITTPGPTSETAMIERNTVVQLNGEGDVDGTIEVRFVGQEALSRRIAARNMDEAARKKVLEEEIKGWVSIKAAVELQGTVNWDQPEQELRANFTVKVPAYATATGRRLLLRAGLFEGRAEAFQDANRIHDIYFPHPFEEVDETTWKLPSGHQVRSLPEKKSAATIFGDYAMSVENSAGALHATRHFTARLLYLPVSYYAAVRSFFNSARLSDETQIVLDTAEEPNATKTN